VGQWRVGHAPPHPFDRQNLRFQSKRIKRIGEATYYRYRFDDDQMEIIYSRLYDTVKMVTRSRNASD
jgi:hypothetical protein